MNNYDTKPRYVSKTENADKVDSQLGLKGTGFKEAGRTPLGAQGGAWHPRSDPGLQGRGP